MKRFKIQHEFDDEPTYIVDIASDPDEEAFEVVMLSHAIPHKLRQQIANDIVQKLEENTDQIGSVNVKLGNF